MLIDNLGIKILAINTGHHEKVKTNDQETEDADKLICLVATLRKYGGGMKDSKISKTRTLRASRIKTLKALAMLVYLYGCKTWGINMKDNKAVVEVDDNQRRELKKWRTRVEDRPIGDRWLCW